MKFEPTSFAPDAQRILDFAKSEMFDRTFKEGMALVEETAAYLDGPGRAAAKRLSRLGALAYAGESMKLTTRLMQVASWLLVQRAVREGDLALAEAAGEKYRLHNRDFLKEEPLAGVEELPEALKVLAARAAAIHERASRLDGDMYGRADAANAVTEQRAKLEAAFAGR